MKHIEMKNFLMLNNDRKEKPDEKTKYELIAIVSCKGNTLKDSEYFTLIRKGLKGQRFKQWLAYNGNTEVYINDKVALNDFPP